MNFFIDNWLLIATALTSGSLLYFNYTQGSRGFSVSDVVTAINKNKAVVIDVGNSDQSIQRAKRVALADLANLLPNLVKNKSIPLILVCPRGLQSKAAERVAKKLGYENTMVLQGGLKAWSDANLPLVAVAKAAALNAPSKQRKN